LQIFVGRIKQLCRVHCVVSGTKRQGFANERCPNLTIPSAAALNWRTTPMTSEENAKFREEFGLRVTNLLNRLLKAARVGKDRMKQGDLDVLAAATMELLTMALANMPEPIRGKRVEGLSATLAADVAKKRERLEQNILAQHFDTPRGRA
jgi:hypothetical protein